ncbi:Carbohydrate Esterase Family 4 protein [Glomus cerebriforme]|uniref:chitin deacetylase n=1 Tax=Glomus cerebriforme TaxID=658196 RepID=A0A397TAY9_9GLOM|nr:Carbohydrate Esterase Family 4 protein [Glomus cerebriforme]
MLSTIKASFYIFVLSFLTFTINAQLAGQWPPVDKPPPPNADWTKLVDQTKVPAIAQSKNENDCSAKGDVCNWSCTNCVRTTDIIQCPNKYDWGLSFDDGPTEFTPTLLDYLESQNITLTFFVIGSRVIENPQTLQRAVAAGHQIAVHTWSHTALTTQSNEEIIAEIKWTETAIKQAVGLTPKYMRPPYGNIDDRVRGILTQLGYKVVIWDKDTNDWMSGEPGNTFQLPWIEGNFTEWVKENDPTGHISLEHDLYKQTAAQAPNVVPIVQGAGFTIKPVFQCVGDAQPYLESTTTAPATDPAAAPATDPATDPAAAPATDPATDPAVAPATDPVTPTSNVQYVDGSPSAIPTTSNAISHMINNNYLLLLVLFTLWLFKL